MGSQLVVMTKAGTVPLKATNNSLLVILIHHVTVVNEKQKQHFTMLLQLLI